MKIFLQFTSIGGESVWIDPNAVTCVEAYRDNEVIVWIGTMSCYLCANAEDVMVLLRQHTS